MTRVVAGAALLALAASAPGQTPSSAAPPRGRGAAPQDERRRIHSDAAEDALERGFKDPPDSARPRVWWHWLNGNVTKEGITADLEWMKRVGIAGMQMFDGSLGVPQFTEKRLVWMTPEWKDAFKHSAAEADRLGLEMAMAASGGWSETAGPWGGKPSWIQYEFAQPFRIQALSITVGPGVAFFGATPPVGQFQTSRDGTSWATLLNLPGPEPLFGGFPVRTYALPETTARLYRFVFPPPPPNPMGELFGMPPVRQFDFAEIELFSSPRVHVWEDKASFATFMQPAC